MKQTLKLDRVFLVALTSAPLLLSSSEPVHSKSGMGKSAKAALKTPLSRAKVREIERKIPTLKPGTKDVVEIIGLSTYSNRSGILGSGPTSDYRFSYYLRKGYSLTLVYDFTKQPPVFKRAEMHKPK